jgi:ribosomal protein L11 methyltransferase
MNDKINNFTQILFYLEDSIKEIFIDYIENESEFLSIDFNKVERDYWFCKLILKSKKIKEKFLKKINDFRKNFKLLSLESCTDNDITKNQIYFEEFENKDWLGENIQTLRPINIKNFIIYDNDNYKLFNPTKKLLKINASYAFGTGYHSTTRYCIENMYECSKSKKFQNILDYGCGSGILGIAAKKLMPYSKITLIDVDNLAVKISKFNLKKNNIISNNNVFEVSPKKRKYIKKNFYNLIFANILLPQLKSLIKEFTYILDHNGLLIVSGILIYQKNHLINLYRKFKIYPIKISEEEKWITITFKKKNEKAY